MAYNLESLIQILDEILHPHHGRPWVLASEKRPQIESLLKKARCLNELFDKYSPVVIGDTIRVLENRIRDAVYEAENVIVSHLVDQSFSSSPPDLHKMIEEFDVVKEELMKMSGGSQMRNTSSSFSILSREAPHRDNTVVGLSKDLIQLKERLTGQQSKLEIIPIVGMGGIGKTTLAQNLYDDPLVVSYFDKRAWITISQEYDLKEVLLSLLRCLLGNLTDEMIEKEVDKLILHIHQTLWGRRYLIVLDDMWSSKVWDDIRRCFPDNEQGSRMLVTTREMSVVNYVDSQKLYHQMNFLNDIESWNLLCKNVFAEEACPMELEKVGKKIAHDCAGLPLAIHVVGGLLAQLDRNQQSWQQVANDVGSVVASEDEKFSNILSLSYYHLPNHLKPCFLHVGTFPEDYQIRPSKLIRLWVAGGFIKPILDKCLEEAAGLYLKALVDRNLLLVHQEEVKGNAKSYVMHDLLRDLCIRKAKDEKFIKLRFDYTDHDVGCECIQKSFMLRSNFDLSVTRSILYFGRQMYFPKLLISRVSNLKLIRVLDILRLEGYPIDSLEPLLKLVNLRYLALWTELDSFYQMPSFYNLQTMIMKDSEYADVRLAAETIINMPRLRHIKFIRPTVPLLDLSCKEDVASHELQTLSNVAVDNNFTRAILVFPNLKKLGVVSARGIRISSTIDLTCLTKLETLKCSSTSKQERSNFFSFLISPPSLKKLTLKNGRIPIEFMETIGILPNLEVLKLQHCTFTSPTWEPTEGQFSKLRLLLLEDVDLVNWIADETHYPRLERLIIRDCSKLEEIPCDIGAIPTLQSIEVHGGHMKPSALDSARRIQDDQLELGNDLQVRIFG